MGNRSSYLPVSGNIYIKDHDGKAGVYLYTHWGRDTLLEALRDALAKGERWEDPSYLARIIFCQMLKAEGWAPGFGDLDGTSGFGISSILGGGADFVLEVDCDKRTVEKRGSFASVTFSQFIELINDPRQHVGAMRQLIT